MWFGSFRVWPLRLTRRELDTGSDPSFGNSTGEKPFKKHNYGSARNNYSSSKNTKICNNCSTNNFTKDDPLQEKELEQQSSEQNQEILNLQRNTNI